MTLYFDYNATTPMPPSVKSEVVRALGDASANPSSLHRAGRRAAELLERARSEIAQGTGARPEQVILCSGATEANFLAIAGVLMGTRRNRMAVSAVEHPSVINAARHMCERLGKELLILPVTKRGAVDLEKMGEVLNGEECLVSVTMANHETGALQPLEAILQWAEKHGVLVHVDAAQALGKLPVRFGMLRADLLSISGHKVGGPAGCGGLLVRSGVPIVNPFGGGFQERGLRPGTEPLMAAVGFGAACRLLLQSTLAATERLFGLRERLAEGLNPIDGVKRVTPEGRVALCQTLSMVFPGAEGDAVMTVLDQHGIAVSTGSACSVGRSEPSPVLLAMGYSAQEAKTAIRYSMGLETSLTDVDRVIEATKFAVAEVRSHGIQP